MNYTKGAVPHPLYLSIYDLRLLDVPEKLTCVKDKKCRVNLHLPSCMLGSKNSDSEEEIRLSATILKLDKYDFLDIVSSESCSVEL